MCKWGFVICCLFLSHLSAFCQSDKIIKGYVTDLTGEAISYASVLLTNNSEETVAFTISEEDGRFKLNTSEEGIFSIEVSHISYVPHRQTIELIKNIFEYSVSVVLESRSQNLDEIIIQTPRGVASQSGDTLSYNLNAYTTGNEQKLKDLLHKLPGLEIDSYGKIRSEGKIIDYLLIDGKPFFGENHQLATDHLNAEMVEGIDLLKDYESFEEVKDLKGSKETALNIKIKEKYKGKPTGDIDVYGGHKNRYRLHSNLFSFGKTHNISFIGDMNTTGQSSVSLIDYIQMTKNQKYSDRRDSENTISAPGNLPDFLIDQKNRTAHHSQFGALNAVFAPAKKLGIEVFSILNKDRIREKRLSENQFYTSSNALHITDDIQTSNKHLINQTNLNAKYKPGTNSLISYFLEYKPNRMNYITDANSSIEKKEQQTKQVRASRGNILGQRLEFVNQLSHDKLLSINAFSNQIQDNEDLNVSSTVPLFGVEDKILQHLKNESKEYGVFSNYTQRTTTHLLNWNVGYQWQNNSFYSTARKEDLSKYKQDYFYTGLYLENNQGFFEYKTGLNVRNYSNRFNLYQDKKKWVYLPVFETKLNFSQTHYLSFKYRRQAGFPDAKQLNSFNYAENYRIFRLNSAMEWDKIITNNRFNLTYFYFNLYNGTQIFVNSIYNKTTNGVGRNNEVIGNYNYLNLMSSPYSRNWGNHFQFQTRADPVKMIFKLELDYNYFVFNNYINSNLNKTIASNYGLKPVFSSYFKDSWINYEAGIELQQNGSKFQLMDIENKGTMISPFIHLNGIFGKNWGYLINNTFLYYKTRNTKRKRFQLDFELRYHREFSKFKYWIAAEDIFNLTSPQIIETYTTENRMSQNIIYQMPGLIGVGVSFSF